MKRVALLAGWIATAALAPSLVQSAEVPAGDDGLAGVEGRPGLREARKRTLTIAPWHAPAALSRAGFPVLRAGIRAAAC
jgi:hypothetical protein